MNTCQARRGFLTLRDCGAPSSTNCDSCQRPMCTEHLASASGYTACLDCYAKGHPADAATGTDGEWAYGYRSRYYSAYGYSPFYSGRTVYTDYDTRSFDDDVNIGATDDDDVERAGFADS
jgi:hypothetical protein